jgi:protein involved in polysaccharide export with SLBB domain
MTHGMNQRKVSRCGEVPGGLGCATGALGVERLRRAVTVLALGFSVITTMRGQMAPQQQTVDCNDPAVMNSDVCQSPSRGTMLQQQQQTGTQTPTPQTTTQQGTGRDLYVDSAGYSESNETQAQKDQDQRLRRLTARPEPLTDLQKLAHQATGEWLPIFGRQLFQSAPSTFAPADQIPASPDYVLGPGDEVILRLWGHTNVNARLTVDRAGSIYVPQVGAVDVAGLRFRDLQDHLKQELSRTYRNFDLSVNLGKLRSIQVFVLGEARVPGSYTVSSLSTVFNALLVSGGPTMEGSLRRVELRRSGKTVETIDLYDFVLNGDRSKDVVLQSGDVLFIPFVGAQVAVSGSVRHPAIYELLPTSTVGEVLKEAGGPNSTASRARILIERIEDHHERHAMSVALDAEGLSTRMMDGDVMHVDPVLDGYKNSVTIRGNLANAGRFPWHPGMKLSEIIPDRESLLTNDYWRERNRLGLPTPLFQPLQPLRRQGYGYGYPSQGQGYDDGQAPTDQRLQTNDQRQQQGYDPTGELPQGAQGTGQQQYGQYGQDGVNGTQQYGDTPRNGVAARDQMQDADQELGRASLADQQVTSARNLAPVGQRTEIKVSVPEIDWSYAVIQRLDAKTLKNSLIPFDLGRLVNDHDPSMDLTLEPGDVVTIVSQSDIHVRQDDQTKYVRLEGEFVNSGVYSVGPGETLADVVKKAGGLTDKAYLYGSSFTRETARVLQQQRLNEYISSLTMQMERSSAERVASTATASSVTTAGQASEERALLQQMRNLRATGRVVLEFTPESAGVGSIPAIPLEDGDTFRVPSRPIIVSVVGAVYGQNVFLYNSRNRVRDYLLLAGRPNRIADRNHAFVIRADGSIFSRDASGGLWGDRFGSAPIHPGDTVVVPEKPIRPSTLREVIDWSQVFSQFAIGAAAIEVIK